MHIQYSNIEVESIISHVLINSHCGNGKLLQHYKSMLKRLPLSLNGTNFPPERCKILINSYGLQKLFNIALTLVTVLEKLNDENYLGQPLLDLNLCKCIIVCSKLMLKSACFTED